MSPARRKALEERSICPWCSASVAVTAVTCPSCGASLRDVVEGDVLGVTQIDPAAVSRAARIKPGRLATWLGAERTESPDIGGRVEAPSKEVREEMLRLELAAIDAEIEAKAKEAAAQRDLPEDGSPGDDKRGDVKRGDDTSEAGQP